MATNNKKYILLGIALLGGAAYAFAGNSGNTGSCAGWADGDYLRQDLRCVPNLPLGLRNNNPLNIWRYDANDWLGKDWTNTGNIERFTTLAYGLRATIFLFRKKINQGHNTIRKLAANWTPAGHGTNNPAQVAQDVAQITGIGIDTVLDANDRGRINDIIRAYSVTEIGWADAATQLPWVLYQQLNAAWGLL